MTFTMTSNCLAFYHTHAQWQNILNQDLVVDKNASQFKYLEVLKKPDELKKYFKDVSAVELKDYNEWTDQQKLAFLLNAYNAFTVQLIVDGLAKKPNLKSINDLGTLVTSPWKIKFFNILGESSNLDHIEQELARHHFDEPAMHMAFNCASISYPNLSATAYVADQLDAQLEKAAREFLADKSKNQYSSEQKLLKLSSIFKWYGEDFEKSKKRGPLNRFLADHMDLSSADKEIIRQGKAKIEFLDYNWALNNKP